jgi:hypothetical protein
MKSKILFILIYVFDISKFLKDSFINNIKQMNHSLLGFEPFSELFAACIGEMTEL